MRQLLMALCLCLVAMAAHTAEDRNVTATTEDQIREILSEAVKLYRSGRNDQAAITLKNALLRNPENRLIYEFYLALGDRTLMAMQDQAELEDVMADVLRRARIWQRHLRRDPAYIGLLIDKVAGANEEERLVATTELVAIGPIAIPHLVQRIGDNRNDDVRVWCRMVLSRMGYRAVVPLCEALNSADERLASTVATILADIGDPRALPRLQLMVERSETGETLRRVCTNAVAAIAQRSRRANVPNSERLYFEEALRYFRDGDQVRDEMVSNESLMWRWDEAAEEPKLGYVRVPRHAWNELMAEELAFDGLEAHPGSESYHPVLAAILQAQVVETTRRHELAQERITAHLHPDESLDAIGERLSAVSEVEDRVRMVGPQHLYRSIQQSIASERYDVAFRLMDHLRDGWLARAETHLPEKADGMLGEKAGTVLVAALDHPEKRVRYHAAVTLAYLDPKLQFFNAEKVVPTLADAVGEWGMLAILIVEPDPRARNTARFAVQRGGMLAYTAGDGFEAHMRLNESPAKDAIIIAGDLPAALRDEHGVVIDVEEQSAAGLVRVLRARDRTAQTPIFISLPDNEELAVLVRNAFQEMESGGVIQGFVNRPYEQLQIKGLVEEATRDAVKPRSNLAEREEISRLAAESLAAIDVITTQFEFAQAVEALLATVENRADEIRRPALRALGHFGAREHIDRVTEVYRAQVEVLATRPETRAAFLYCIGLLDPTTEQAVTILGDAMQATGDENRIVRATAAEAIGRGGSVPSPLLYQFQRQQRLDVRAPGAGADADAQ